MTASQLENEIKSLCSHITFEYRRKNCGVDPFSMEHFEMWYGERFVKLDSKDAVMNNPFFDGLSLADIADGITVT